MEVIEQVEAFSTVCDEAQMMRRRIGFVPTMGYLHEGHASLLQSARLTCDTLALSVFVNPLQFGPTEDLDRYPRDLEQDLALARREGVDLVFAPSAEEMYPGGEQPMVTVDPGPVGEVLEGSTRPGHFRGVLTVVAKLFSLVGRCEAFFGEKDAQQLFLIRRMARDLNLPIHVSGWPTVREPDGLAMSSRNAYLSPEERAAATCLSRALSRAVELVDSDERGAARVRDAMREVVEAEPLAKLDYATVVDEEVFTEVEVIPEATEWAVIGGETPAGWTPLLGPGDHRLKAPAARALIAAWIGSTRLIDNVPLP